MSTQEERKAFNDDSEHQFAKPVEFIQRDIEVPEMIQVGELSETDDSERR